MSHRFTAVIPARNAAATLNAAVLSATRQVPPIEQIVIAVGPSTDDTEDVAAALADRFEGVQVVSNAVGTIPAGLNAAIAASGGDFIVRIDAHAELPEGYTAAVAEAFADPTVANVGGTQLAVGQTAMERAVAVALMSPFGAGGAAFHRAGGPPRAVDTVYLGVFRRTAVSELGWFDEALLTNEDYELNWRIRQAGFVVWLDPRLQVVYRPRGSIRAVARQFWRYGWWKQKMLRRHPGSLRLRQTLAPLLVTGLVVSAALAVWNPFLGLVLPTIYVFACLAASLLVGGAGRPHERLRVAVVFAAMHLSWGAGYLASAIQAILNPGAAGAPAAVAPPPAAR